MDIDGLLREMERDDLEGATKLPPIQYAKLRGIRPQKVYAAIRNGKLEPTKCECGRKVVVVEEADEHFRLGKWERTDQAVPEEEEVAGEHVDTDDTVGRQA